MKTSDFMLYLLVMAAVTYLIRTIPLLLVREKIQNRFFSSFLEYIPYAVLGCMTFPVIFYSTGDRISGLCGTLVGVFFAYRKKGLLFVALSAVAAVLVVKLVLAAIS